jgi:F-type H+-transporting ATPase subunit b
MTHLTTIGFQVVNFLVLLFLLRRYLWTPVRATIAQRQKAIDDAEAGAKARAEAADEHRAAAEARAEAADHERARLLAGAAVALATDREKVLETARATAEAERREAAEKLEEERGRAAGDLADATLDVALTVAERLLGEVKSAAITGAFLDRICEHIEGLPAAELASLRAELGASSTLQVATAPALDDAARARLLARLGPIFGATVKLSFVVDAALIAGAELRFPHARLGHSFRHGLAAARRELGAKGTPHPELTLHQEIVDE